MANESYNVYVQDKGVPVKAWTKGVPVEDQARQQLLNAAQMPFVFQWIAAMPEPTHSAPQPSSRAATRCSSTAVVGLLRRP